MHLIRNYFGMHSNQILGTQIQVQFFELLICYWSHRIQQMIDLDMMPPDWQFAQNHAEANKPGLVESVPSFDSNESFCPCCLKPIIKNQVSLFSNSKQLEFMGFGFPLYFIFIKYCIVLLLILICSYSSMSLYWAVSDDQTICHRRLLGSSGQTICTSVFIKLARIEKYLTTDEIIMRITSFIIHLFTLLYIRDNISKSKQYFDEKTTSLSDFSLVIKNLPLKEGIQQNIKDFIHNHFQKKWQQLKKINVSPQFQSPTKVIQITLLPGLQDYFKLVEQKNQIVEEKRQLIKQMEVHEGHRQKGDTRQTEKLRKQLVLNSKIQNTTSKINLINQKISELSSINRALAKQDKLKSQAAIITLNSQVFKSEILQYANQMKLDSPLLKQYFGYFQGQIQIEEAPEPNEIIWHAVNFSEHKNYFSKILGWVLSLIFIAIITVGFYFLLLLKTQFLLEAISGAGSYQLNSTSRYRTAVFLVFLAIFLIVFFNKLVMGAVLHFFTKLQKHQNTSEEEFSFALKYTLGLFFTTALMTLAVEAVTFHNFYSHEYGVIEQESFMFIINALLIPLIWLVNPWQIATQLVRKFKANSKHYTQREANRIMSDTPYTIGKRYAEIVETIWFTFLYASLIPVGGFITLIGLSFYYWVDKYNLLRRSSLSQNISGKLAIVSLKLLDFTLVLKPLGQLIFDTSIRNTYQIESIVLVGVGLLYLILPIDKLLQFFHQENFLPEQKSFEEVKDTFLETYQTLHPIMSFKAFKIFESMKKSQKKKNFMKEMQITEMPIDSMSKGSPFGYEFTSNNLYSLNSPNKEVFKQSQNKEAQQQFLKYQYRSRNVVNTASKSYFQSNKRRGSQAFFKQLSQ